MVVTLPDFTCHLFIPKFDYIYKIWMKTFEIEDALSTYPDFKIHFNDELEQFVKERSKGTIYVNKGVNSDSGLTTLHPTFDWMENLNVNKNSIHDILSESRSVKTEEEIKILQVASQITSEAHIWTMRRCKPGIRETVLASVFDAYCKENYNCKFLAYNQICACGINPATLHYVSNDDIIPEKSMCLLDMGHSVHHYVSDVTCCYPSDGVFT
jgi:Xaa-Pro dipeptidase